MSDSIVLPAKEFDLVLDVIRPTSRELEKENIDLIVVGTRGRSGFKKLLLGSVASGIVTYAHCPVLVVK